LRIIIRKNFIELGNLFNMWVGKKIFIDNKLLFSF